MVGIDNNKRKHFFRKGLKASAVPQFAFEPQKCQHKKFSQISNFDAPLKNRVKEIFRVNMNWEKLVRTEYEKLRQQREILTNKIFHENR